MRVPCHWNKPRICCWSLSANILRNPAVLLPVTVSMSTECFSRNICRVLIDICTIVSLMSPPSKSYVGQSKCHICHSISRSISPMVCGMSLEVGFVLVSVLVISLRKFLQDEIFSIDESSNGVLVFYKAGSVKTTACDKKSPQIVGLRPPMCWTNFLSGKL